eukprot:753369-Amphidinium_carterae.1
MASLLNYRQQKSKRATASKPGESIHKAIRRLRAERTPDKMRTQIGNSHIWGMVARSLAGYQQAGQVDLRGCKA